MKLWKPDSSYAAKKADLWSALCAEVDSLPSIAAVEDWWLGFQIKRLRDLPPVYQEPLRDRLDDRKRELVAMAQSRFLDRQWLNAMERDK